jgi:hypothetical protein
MLIPQAHAMEAFDAFQSFESFTLINPRSKLRFEMIDHLDTIHMDGAPISERAFAPFSSCRLRAPAPAIVPSLTNAHAQIFPRLFDGCLFWRIVVVCCIDCGIRRHMPMR